MEAHSVIREALVNDLRSRLAVEEDARAAAQLARTISDLLERVEVPAAGADPVTQLAEARARRRGRAAG